MQSPADNTGRTAATRTRARRGGENQVERLDRQIEAARRHIEEIEGLMRARSAEGRRLEMACETLEALRNLKKALERYRNFVSGP
jgi:hypothetical protein